MTFGEGGEMFVVSFFGWRPLIVQQTSIVALLKDEHGVCSARLERGRLNRTYSVKRWAAVLAFAKKLAFSVLPVSSSDAARAGSGKEKK